MNDKILLTLDGSGFAERALQLATEFAQQRSAELTLLQVVRVEGMKADAQAYLTQKAEFAKGKGVSCETKVVLGKAAEVILEQSSNFQLLVMTSHGRSEFDHAILGSVAEKVVRKADCPVFILRDRQVSLRELKRVMVPLDGFQFSELAIPQAVQICQATGGTLVLSRIDEAAGYEVGLLSKETEGPILEQYLVEKSKLVPDGVEVQTSFDFGSAARCLLSMINRENIDLVVMTSHGRGGFNRWVCGSVTENVLRSSSAPVLVVRPSADDLERIAKSAS